MALYFELDYTGFEPYLKRMHQHFFGVWYLFEFMNGYQALVRKAVNDASYKKEKIWNISYRLGNLYGIECEHIRDVTEEQVKEHLQRIKEL